MEVDDCKMVVEDLAGSEEADDVAFSVLDVVLVIAEVAVDEETATHAPLTKIWPNKQFRPNCRLSS